MEAFNNAYKQEIENFYLCQMFLFSTLKEMNIHFTATHDQIHVLEEDGETLANLITQIYFNETTL